MFIKSHVRIGAWCLLLVVAPLGAVGLASTTAGNPAATMTPCGPAWASYGTGTSEIVFAADQPGTDGNSIAVVFEAIAPNSPLAVSVSGSTITVILATNGSGTPISTAADVAAAITANPAAAALVDVYVPDVATGLVAPGTADLEGGTACAIGVESLPWGAAKQLWN